LRPAPLLFFLAVFFVGGCAGDSTPDTPPLQTRQDAQWEPIRSWTGRGSEQLDSFPSDTGALRVEWEAKRTANATGQGSLRIVIHSAISGRPLMAPIVDRQGEGAGTVYVSEEPRVFFAVVTSQDIEWKITIAERVR
jgi:hypothetical protein